MNWFLLMTIVWMSFGYSSALIAIREHSSWRVVFASMSAVCWFFFLCNILFWSFL